ncbi:transcriptional regulator [Stenotrophomonas rhizophila]|uniref:transcriptional regulator n=1 Tax=Stenotrophomonas rhizophila TaxID=216778 RepID=UPI0028A670D1|nr:YdaS family helix-turn-helix protein [Stenotrophomonas rhizophila]
MDIVTYRQSKGLTQSGFAKLLTESGSPATQALISKWETGEVVVPPPRWQPIERLTEGEVTRGDLRPDLFTG